VTGARADVPFGFGAATADGPVDFLADFKEERAGWGEFLNVGGACIADVIVAGVFVDGQAGDGKTEAAAVRKVGGEAMAADGGGGGGCGESEKKGCEEGGGEQGAGG
jgi:hypothetical protein